MEGMLAKLNYLTSVLWLRSPCVSAGASRPQAEEAGAHAFAVL